MRFSEDELEENKLRSLKEQQKTMLVEMMLHKDWDSAADFDRWWIEEGRMAAYFSLKQKEEELLQRRQQRKMLASFTEERTRKIRYEG